MSNYEATFYVVPTVDAPLLSDEHFRASKSEAALQEFVADAPTNCHPYNTRIKTQVYVKIQSCLVNVDRTNMNTPLYVHAYVHAGEIHAFLSHEGELIVWTIFRGDCKCPY